MEDGCVGCEKTVPLADIEAESMLATFALGERLAVGCGFLGRFKV